MMLPYKSNIQIRLLSSLTAELWDVIKILGPTGNVRASF